MRLALHLNAPNPDIYVERPKTVASLNTTSIPGPFLNIHEIAVRACQLDSVPQLVRALHQNRRDAGLFPGRGPIIVFLKAAPAKTNTLNFHLQKSH